VCVQAKKQEADARNDKLANEVAVSKVISQISMGEIGVSDEQLYEVSARYDELAAELDEAHAELHDLRAEVEVFRANSSPSAQRPNGPQKVPILSTPSLQTRICASICAPAPAHTLSHRSTTPLAIYTRTPLHPASMPPYRTPPCDLHATSTQVPYKGDYIREDNHSRVIAKPISLTSRLLSHPASTNASKPGSAHHSSRACPTTISRHQSRPPTPGHLPPSTWAEASMLYARDDCGGPHPHALRHDGGVLQAMSEQRSMSPPQRPNSPVDGNPSSVDADGPPLADKMKGSNALAPRTYDWVAPGATASAPASAEAGAPADAGCGGGGRASSSRPSSRGMARFGAGGGGATPYTARDQRQVVEHQRQILSQLGSSLLLRGAEEVTSAHTLAHLLTL
jgi:hypothetical protein